MVGAAVVVDPGAFVVDGAGVEVVGAVVAPNPTVSGAPGLRASAALPVVYQYAPSPRRSIILIIGSGQEPQPGKTRIWGTSPSLYSTPAQCGVATNPVLFFELVSNVATATLATGLMSSRTSGSSIEEAYPAMKAISLPFPEASTSTRGLMNQNGVRVP